MAYAHAGYYINGLLNTVGTSGTNPVNSDANGNLRFYARTSAHNATTKQLERRLKCL